MPNAITLSYETDEETSGAPEEETATPFDDDTSGFFDTLISGGGQLLSSILGGGGGAKPGGGIGESLGAIAGAGLGTLAGGAGASIGANIGKMAGGAVESLVRSQVAKKKPKKKPRTGKPQRKITKRERKILVDAEQMTKRTGDPMYVQEARLRVYRPAEYKRKRDAGMLLSQIMASEAELDALPEPPPKRPRLNLPALMASPQLNEPEAPYDDTASPDARPRPLQHVSASPMSAAQLEAMIRAVPLLRMHDPRLLRTLTAGGGAREVSGVDPTRGTYHALPGETPHGITKKLTGQTERTQELLAANPGKPESDPVWNIPPGWLHYAGDTGANLITARKYVVVKDDWPQKIATKLGAFPARSKWWSELKAANPHKPTQSGSGNWVSLFAGEEIGIPNEWPDHPLAIAINGAPVQPSTPGVPAPGKTTTLDPAVVPHTQALLASWALRNPGDCNPSDFGRNPMDLVSGFTPRTTQALASFQTWWNKKQPTRPLPTTGELDQATYNALIEENNASNAPVPWFETVPQGQTSTQQQQPSGNTTTNTSTTSGGTTTSSQGQPTQRPAWYPQDLPWPPPIPGMNTTSQQPSGGTSTSTTPSGNSTSSGGTSTSTNSSLPGLPAERPAWYPQDLPWPPPIPGLNTTSQQPSGGTSTSTTPSGNATNSGGTSTSTSSSLPGLPAERPTWYPQDLPWPPPIPGLNTASQQPSGGTSTSTTPSGNSTNSGGTSTSTSSSLPGLPAERPAWYPQDLPWPPSIPGMSTTSQQPSGGTTSSGNSGNTSTTNQQPTDPRFDDNLTAAEREEIYIVLDSVAIHPDTLDQLADTYEANGHPRTAKTLRARADALRILIAEGEIVAQQQGGSGNWPGSSGGSTGSTPTSGSSGGLLPVIAAIGAGLAFS
ncbi:hypothetical protein [Polyangium spumosum]|uniref:LysM domain-containing protein n=1 Tax=Polyangium spumosum TaxID=889282 RepID=A0A6N7Q2B6_9BACT|nr:hypothetical protein [Polyangium spumosum]MRG98602.1 hypothetical protein [Polyangium spumosum]